MDLCSVETLLTTHKPLRSQDSLKGNNGWVRMRLEGIIDMTRCLLVDQDHEERQALSQLLGQYGFDMAETASADAALKHCRTNLPDIVVAADRLGSMSPGEVVKRVRRG